jgi:hypothetical protein
MGQEAISMIDLQENLMVSALTATIMMNSPDHTEAAMIMEADQIIDLEVDMEMALHAADLMVVQEVHLKNRE